MDQKSKETEETIDVFPVYEYGELYPIVSETINNFLNNFKIKLRSNHWTRVKATTHRISQLKWDGYDDIKPLANVMNHFSIMVDNFLKSPIEWKDQHGNSCSPPDTKRGSILNPLVTAITSALQTELRQNMFDQNLNLWDSAYKRRGIGSTSLRMKDIEYILEKSLTIPKHILVKYIESIVKSELKTLEK